MSGELCLPTYLFLTVKFGKVDFGVGHFSWNGLGPLVTLCGHQYAVDKERISGSYLLPAVENQICDDVCFYLHGNSTVYKESYIQSDPF